MTTYVLKSQLFGWKKHRTSSQGNVAAIVGFLFFWISTGLLVYVCIIFNVCIMSNVSWMPFLFWHVFHSYVARRVVSCRFLLLTTLRAAIARRLPYSEAAGSVVGSRSSRRAEQQFHVGPRLNEMEMGQSQNLWNYHMTGGMTIYSPAMT